MNISETNFEVGLIFYQMMATMFKVHNSLVTQLLSFGQLLCFEVTGQSRLLQYIDSNSVFTPEQDNDKTNVEPVHSYDPFHTRFVGPGVTGIIGWHRFNICLVVVLLSCYTVIA